MSDEAKEYCEVAAVVSLNDLLDQTIRLKLKAIRKKDDEFFDIADGLEHYLKLLRDKNTIFERG